MLARVLALAVAACIGATGTLPVAGGWRCVAMQRPMRPSARDCCKHCDAPPSSIGLPCCVAVPGQTLEARAPAPTIQPRLAPAPLTAILSSAPVPLVGAPVARVVASLPRGAPPGDRLDRFSAILRV